jgi:hypothetical protein
MSRVTPQRSSNAMTTPSRPIFGGARVQPYADGSEYAEGSHRRSVAYVKDVATPMALLAGWHGRVIRPDFWPCASYQQAVGTLRHSCSVSIPLYTHFKGPIFKGYVRVLLLKPLFEPS